MPVSERHLQVKAPAEKVWGIVSDPKQWGALLTHAGAGKMGSVHFDPLPMLAPGVTLQSTMHHGRRSTSQTWSVSEFDPAQGRVKLTLVPSGYLKPCSMSFGFTLKPVSSIFCTVDFRAEFEWSNPLFGMLGSIFSMINIETLADNISRNLEEVVTA